MEELLERERRERELKAELLRLEMEECSDRDKQAQEAKEERLRWEAEVREFRNRLEMKLWKKQLERVSASIEKAEADRQSARDSLAASTCEVEDWALKRGAYTKWNRAIGRLMRCQDSDDVEYYLEHFEKIVEDGEIPGEVYLYFLRSQFSGRHADCLRDAEADGCVDCAESKSRLQRVTGSTIREAENSYLAGINEHLVV